MSIPVFSSPPSNPAAARPHAGRFAEKLGLGASDLRLLEAVLRCESQSADRKF